MAKRKARMVSFQSRLLDAVGQAVIATDIQGKITYWNRRAEVLYGWSAEEVMDRLAEEVLVSEDQEERAAEIRSELRAGRSWSGEFVVRRKDGTTFPAMVTDTPVHDEQGNLVGIIGVSTDITELKQTEELRRSEERFRLLVEGVKDYAIFMLDPQGRITSWNAGAERIKGYRAEEVLGRHFSCFYTEEDLERGHPQEVLRLAEKQGRYEEEGWRVRKDGSRFWASVLITALRDHEGNLRGFSKVVRDVTERKETEEALKSSEEFFRALYEDVCHPIFLLDSDLNFVDVNPYACKFYGYSREEFMRMKVQDITLPQEVDSQPKNAEKVREQGSIFIVERQHRKKNGEVVTVTADASKITRSGQELYVSKITDITERKRLEERLEHRASHDFLTDLPNRTLLMNRLEQALARANQRGGEVATLLVDLDDFKVINDSLGHEAGDHLLVSVGWRLRALVGSGDTVARFGGDEFVVVLEDTDAEEASRVAQRLVERMRTFFAVDGRKLTITCSVGIALGGGAAGERATDLLRRADMALYEAKGKGKDRYGAFEEAMEARARERLEKEHSLRQTIEREKGFVVHYQPVVSLNSGRIVGFEALVRWNHPWRGLLMPAEFIPLAEQTGVIVGIGPWVLREACRQAKEWHECYPSEQPLTVSMNLSARQLAHPGLVEDVAYVLKSSGLEPRSLILEVTECAMMRDVDASVAVLRRLKDLGVRIAVDDFGKDYSSLSYLKRLPVDILKIDRSFVDGLGTDGKDEGIVRAVIDLARTLGLEVVAEGVESGEQLAHLREIGCELVQGFYFWHPFPAERASELLATYNYIYYP